MRPANIRDKEAFRLILQQELLSKFQQFSHLTPTERAFDKAKEIAKEFIETNVIDHYIDGTYEPIVVVLFVPSSTRFVVRIRPRRNTNLRAVAKTVPLSSECKRCFGTGAIVGFFGQMETCPVCRGAGRAPKFGV